MEFSPETQPTPHLPDLRASLHHGAQLLTPTLETERMRLRMFAPDDLDALALIFSNPQVMRYLGDGRSAAPDLVERETLPALMPRDEWEQRRGATAS